MAETDTYSAEPAAIAEIELESSTYEIIRNRLAAYDKELRARLEQLNQSRKDVFGSIDTALLGTERITTEHNCVPRDMVAIGDQFIFGYNVHFGLKSETKLEDVFSVYEFKDGAFHAGSLDLIRDPQFERDFKEVYRYYKNAVFSKFFLRGPLVYMKFRVGRNVTDIKSFKWAVQDQKLVYVDSRSDHEVRYPPQHEFEWKRTHRDLHHSGKFPHISIEDRVFVETVGGDLTIKIENNTQSGQGIYAEDVDDPDQTLDDAEIYYAIVGNIILLKIRPYQEENYRYIIYNERIQQARRVDSIQHACVLLPDDHGLIFSNGYYLQSGEHKTFESETQNMLFERRIAAPNGEDFLYLFYNRETGVYVLLRYNLIEQQVDTPIVCHGCTFFRSGELICFKTQDEAQKHHALQIWQTPYVGEDYVPHTNTDSYLYKIGNRDIVRGMAECHQLLGLIERDDTYAGLYLDLAKLAGDIIDSYFWIDAEQAFRLREVLSQIKDAAAAAVEEFEKVVRLKQNTRQRTGEVQTRCSEVFSQIQHQRFDDIHQFVTSLSELRTLRGQIISLRELRYIDLQVVDTLEEQVAQQSTVLATRCVDFLLNPAALLPYQQQVEQHQANVDQLTKVMAAKELDKAIAASASELEMLIDIVGNLDIEDTIHRTTIIDNISNIFAKINTARAALKAKTKELLSVEGVAEFNSQMKLLNQGVVNYLDVCDTPEKCEEFLTKMMIQIEELEGRFAEFDEFVVQLTEKRDEIYNAFETRKLSLVETRNRRADSLMKAAERILKGIKARVESLETTNDINAYFASDLMIEKVRDIVQQLDQLDDSVKVDDVQSRLKTVREDAVRQLKDRQELFVDGANVIQLGQHRFSVNVQALDLTTVLRDGEMHLHLTGTNFFKPLTDSALLATRDAWEQEVPSENRDVYRAEYLAYCLLKHLQTGSDSTAEEFLLHDTDQRISQVQRFMGPRYSEAYSKGVHDHDAEKILNALLQMHTTIGLLRYHTQARALAAVCWEHFGNKQSKGLLDAKLKAVGSMLQLFPDTQARERYVAEIRDKLSSFTSGTLLPTVHLLDEAAEYLFHQMTNGAGEFCVSRSAANLFTAFNDHLRLRECEKPFHDSLKAVHRDAPSAFMLARDWVEAFLAVHPAGADQADYVDEVAVCLLRGKVNPQHIIDGQVTRDIERLVGSHRLIEGGKYRLHYNHFMLRLTNFEQETVPRYRQYISLKHDLLERAREQMRLEEFRPRVLTSFVRNKLIDSTYLPLIGDNLAKQIGTAGEAKRTDLMGLLLLVSPPGYGKTTLMEYVANRLGIIFMKINGPAIGHEVTSLDPVEAPNAGSREELEKLNLSFEMGDNVMIYLDDIQHCNPEFLQKFISLCDAQRKIEGVYKGRTRTYDLRGRKVCVVMAGNPYTESGERFQIPDMLANRADIYNLGEIIGESAEAFELSYLENALTSNPVLSRLASGNQHDVHAIYKMAQHESREGIELVGNYSLEELNEYMATMKKLIRVRDVILRVNREYIRSAAQADEYRTEPPFKLQGSYRNMNRIAEKVVPIMNDEELESLILSNYENDAQTLTSDNEANMLKFKELTDSLSEQEASRWEEIKRAFSQNVKMKGIDAGDKVGQVIVQLSSFNEGLHAIRSALADGMTHLALQGEASMRQQDQAASLVERLSGLEAGLDAIGGSLSRGLSKLEDRGSQPGRGASTEADDGQPGHAATDALLSLAHELRALTTGTIPLDPERQTHRVSVMHKVPRSILSVVNNQFELMQNWLAPLLTTAQSQTAEIQKLQESLAGTLQSYETLLEELRRAQERAGAEGQVE